MLGFEVWLTPIKFGFWWLGFRKPRHAPETGWASPRMIDLCIFFGGWVFSLQNWKFEFTSILQKKWIIFNHDFLIPPRALDADLQILVKAGEEFDWERISFILEAGGWPSKNQGVLFHQMTPGVSSKSKELTILREGSVFRSTSQNSWIWHSSTFSSLINFWITLNSK